MTLSLFPIGDNNNNNNNNNNKVLLPIIVVLVVCFVLSVFYARTPLRDTTVFWTYNVTCHRVVLVMERTLFVSAASVHALEDPVHPAYHWVQESVLIHWRTARTDYFQPNLRLLLALQQCALI